MKYPIITIEREYASGGRAVGQQAAKLLGVPCYGSEVLKQAAVRLGRPADYVEHLDEKAPSSLLYSLYMMTQRSFTPDRLSPLDLLQQAEAEVIRRLADEGPCVLIGRCAGAILRHRTDVLRIFVRADTASRKERAVNVYGAVPSSVESLLRRYDKKRASYYSFYSDQKWDDKAAYDLVLDSGTLGIPLCAELVVRAAKG